MPLNPEDTGFKRLLLALPDLPVCQLCSRPFFPDALRQTQFCPPCLGVAPIKLRMKLFGAELVEMLNTKARTMTRDAVEQAVSHLQRAHGIEKECQVSLQKMEDGWTIYMDSYGPEDAITLEF
jgi:hypothetical protein